MATEFILEIKTLDHTIERYREGFRDYDRITEYKESHDEKLFKAAENSSLMDSLKRQSPEIHQRIQQQQQNVQEQQNSRLHSMDMGM